MGHEYRKKEEQVTTGYWTVVEVLTGSGSTGGHITILRRFR